MHIKKKAYSLTEILIVIVIIGIVASLGIANYSRVKTDAISKEAKASLKLIRAAERVYYMEVGTWFYSSNLEAINHNLRLQIPSNASRNFGYSILGITASTDACITGTPTAVTGSTWYLRSNNEEPNPNNCD